MPYPHSQGFATEPLSGRHRRNWAVGLLLVAALLFGAAQAAPAISGAAKGAAIGGYDPVAYFTTDKPAKGDPTITHEWNGATWQFASEEHRALFIAEPEKYAPQYGGYCAYAASLNRVAEGDAKRWKIVDGKLYLNNNFIAHKLWQTDLSGNLEDSERNWDGVRAKIEAKD
ncbi:YHS domain-containing (seleno)protein [Nevskia sp.]|uniref:YHS domain-containing (seleno)protein n=1 Tax=Nevskia sp. TaxID=1929292 RepID=UPI0025D12C24|nr:YHS domain-containing (seleno)protein [Nevskia sp.]